MEGRKRKRGGAETITTGECLKRIRKAMKFSQKDMANALAIHEDSYGLYERNVGKREDPLQGGKCVLMAAQQVYNVWKGQQFWDDIPK